MLLSFERARAADGDYSLEVTAFSLDFPVDPAASQRAFTAPKINERGQVQFSAYWFKGYPQSKLYQGRPGKLTTVTTAGDTAPGPPGMIFKGGPNVGVSAGAGVSKDSLNANGEVLFWSDLLPASQGAPFLYTTAIFRGTPGALTFVAAGPYEETNPGVTPFPSIPGVPYSGSGRLQFSSTVGTSFNPPQPWVITDDGRAYYFANIDALEGGTVVAVATECLIASNAGDSRLVWYKGGPAPELGVNFVFEDLSYFNGDSIGRKNGEVAALTVVRPAGSTDPQTFVTALYQTIGERLFPFFTDGQPIFGAAELSQISIRREALKVDESGNALFEIAALDSSFGAGYHNSLWKKVPAGLVRVIKLGVDLTIDGSTVRIDDPAFGSNFANTAIGGGKAAFIARFTGLGQTSRTFGLFREGASGLQALAWVGMTIPGITATLTSDLGNVVPLLMNEAGEVAFAANSFDQGVTSRAIWVVDRNRGIRRVAYVGQVVSVSGASRTITNLQLPSESPNPPPATLMFNGAGQIVFSARFSDGTSAIFRGTPSGYVEPPLLGQDFYFTGTKDNNWHTKGGAPPTNWESSAKDPRTDPPGDIEIDSAQVFVPEGKSVLLNSRPAFIGSIEAKGDLRLQNHLRVSQASSLKDLVVQGPNGALTLGAATTISGVANWEIGTLTLGNAALRTTNLFIAGSGVAAGSGADARFVNEGRLIKADSGTFTFLVPYYLSALDVPFESAVIEVNNSATLALHAGGWFDGNQKIAVQSDSAIIELAGNFNTDRLRCAVVGAGRVELGTTALDVNFYFSNDSVIQFGGNLNTAPLKTAFNRGLLTGPTAFISNYGFFTWRGGRLAVGTGVGTDSLFLNSGRFEIEASPVPRQMNGKFANEGLVVHHASMELNGVIENSDTWHVMEGAAITDPAGQGLFLNRGNLTLDAGKIGVVDFDVAFQNRAESAASSIHGVVEVYGPPTDPNTLRFRGEVGNLSTNGVLAGGTWRITNGGILSFKSEVNEIAPHTYVLLQGGVIPTLQLRSNSGDLQFSEKTYMTPRQLDNHGAISLYGSGNLTINGDLVSYGKIVCQKLSTITVHGILVNKSGGELENNGTINVDSGDIRSEATGITGEGIYVVPKGTFVFKDGALRPGKSPGELTIDGAMTIDGVSTLEIEIAGTAPADFDRLTVSKAIELGGALQVILFNDFKPTASQTFTVVKATTLTRAFSNVASGQRVTTTDGTGSFAVYYGAGSPHDPNSVVLANWQPAAPGAPKITAQPQALTLTAGGPSSLSVVAGGTGPFSYQWQRNGVDVAGATQASYSVSSTQSSDGGFFSVTVSSALGSVQSAIAFLTVEAPLPSAARLLNLSTRALAQAGDGIVIPGFVIGGSGTKRLLIRGVGPTLGSFGVTGALNNPIMQLIQGNTLLASNDDWGTQSTGITKAAIAATATAVGAFPLPDGSKDASLLVDLPPGAYTVPTSGVAGGTGVAIIEFYDTDQDTSESTLQNISTRGFVGVGERIMISGIVLSPGGSRTFLIRAIGPALEQFGVTGVLADPVLTVVRDGTPILKNDDWGSALGADETAATALKVGAFPLAPGSKDSAFVVTLPPGAYTALVSGKDDSTGVALVEVYLVP